MFSNYGSWTSVRVEQDDIESDSELHFFSAGTHTGTELGCGGDCSQARVPWLRAAWLCLSVSLLCRWRKYFHLFSPGALWQCDVARECSLPCARGPGRMSFISIACRFWCWAGGLSSGSLDLLTCLGKFRVLLVGEGFVGCPVAITYGYFSPVMERRGKEKTDALFLKVNWDTEGALFWPSQHTGKCFMLAKSAWISEVLSASGFPCKS